MNESDYLAIKGALVKLAARQVAHVGKKWKRRWEQGRKKNRRRK